MGPELSDNDPRKVWQIQTTDAAPIGLDEIRDCARRFERTIRRRNLQEYVAFAVVATLYSIYFWAAGGPWTRTGSLLVVVASLYVAYQLRRRGSPIPVPADAPLIDTYCADLERQRDALIGVWRWYLLPPVPGLVIFAVGLEIDNPPGNWILLAIYLLVGTTLFVSILALNRYASRQLQHEIDKLHELQRDA